MYTILDNVLNTDSNPDLFFCSTCLCVCPHHRSFITQSAGVCALCCDREGDDHKPSSLAPVEWGIEVLRSAVTSQSSRENFCDLFVWDISRSLLTPLQMPRSLVVSNHSPLGAAFMQSHFPSNHYSIWLGWFQPERSELGKYVLLDKTLKPPTWCCAGLPKQLWAAAGPMGVLLCSDV